MSHHRAGLPVWAAEYIDAIPMPDDYRQDILAELRRQPRDIARALVARHRRTTAEARTAGEHPPHRRANIELLDTTDATRAQMLPADHSEDMLRAWTDRRAGDCGRRMRGVDGDEIDTYTAGYAYVTGYGIKPPRPDGRIELAGCVARMACPVWWRRQARITIDRHHEQTARGLGLVHRRAGLHISADGFARWCARQRANDMTLAHSVAVCETGEEMPLDQIAATGTGNPAVRRAEMMARISGMESCAERRGDIGLFITATVPAEMHAVDRWSWAPPPGRDITTPREGQAWLSTRWSRARAYLDRHDITVYGLRVAEPHHDGTPHWHMMLFVAPDKRDQVIEAITHYIVDGSTDPDRIEHACTIIEIDRARGSATGYVAKYVSKAIDGHRIDSATTTAADGTQRAVAIDPAERAHRTRAWASQWGIRQFQFFGSPPVGLWRELRRLEPITTNPSAEQLRHAADSGDYAKYIEIMGGPATPAKNRPARVRSKPDVGVGRYGEPRKRPYVEAFGGRYESRPLRWEIEHRPVGERSIAGPTIAVAPANPVEGAASAATAAPRTCGNNCTRRRPDNIRARPTPESVATLIGIGVQPAPERAPPAARRG